MDISPLRDETRSGKRIIRVMFLKPATKDHGLFNSLASWLTSRPNSKHTYAHVELRFSDGTITSITEDPGQVHYDSNRLMRNPNYTSWLEFYVTPEEEGKMQTYARQMYEDQIPFNKCAMYWNFIPCVCSCLAVRRREKGFFCSEYITTILQQAGYCPDLDPATTSPTRLHEEIKNTIECKMSFNIDLYNFHMQTPSGRRAEKEKSKLIKLDFSSQKVAK